jgi:signal transduction histidine kinase
MANILEKLINTIFFRNRKAKESLSGLFSIYSIMIPVLLGILMTILTGGSVYWVANHAFDEAHQNLVEVFSDNIRQDIVKGNQPEAFRKCKRFFSSSKDVEHILIKDSLGREICEEGVPSDSPHIVKKVYFDSQETEIVGTVEVLLKNQSRDKIVITTLFLLVFAFFVLTLLLIKVGKMIQSSIVGPFVALHQALSIPKPNGLSFINLESKLSEIIEIESSLKFYGNEIERLKNLEIKNESLKVVNEIASQVAHDIRSPLAALEVIIGSTDQLPEEKRLIIRSAVGRINDIANNLLHKSKKTNSTEDSNQSSLSIELISPIVDSIVSEKRTQFRERSLVDISINLDKAYGLFSKINPAELKRVISNLINNAVEATDVGKPVEISVTVEPVDEQNLAVVIKDNGKGIPPHILLKLGERGVTYGKENSTLDSTSGSASGSGLGIYHAKQTIESLGGKLIIESDTAPIAPRGSKISIILPLSETPNWFVQELVIYPDKVLVSLDDDISIHQIWSGRLQSLTPKGDKKVEHLIFSSGDEFLRTAPELINRANLFLVDLELLGQQRTGLDIIEEISRVHPEILKKTILVTSRYEESHVRERCGRLGIRLIPKAMAGFVPIKLQESSCQFDAVLLDDDELVRMTWSVQAKKKNIKLKIYTYAHDLLRDLDQFDKTTTFYIDSNLGKDSDGNDVKGEIIGENLYKSGFTELFLCTGYEPEHFTHLKFIKKVFSKTPPF